ncbi:ATP-binding protein [Methanobrevibacter filiformis]|uniref:Archaeal ATPase n=1 Tax=Methanobrevibacter filiformis TaxID=55758 RepID=A0A166C7H2_9EURY|nr:ATP-binding protein [Methanobrevibacter filiformis]KZX14210.1 archaeal ATPase [Methanobrevibacter filiformis]
MIKRELYLNKIRPYMDKNLIKVISGIRRCGKSVILQQICEELENSGVDEENIILINLELMEYSNIKNINEFYDLINKKINNKSRKTYLLLDEIQNIENWEKLVNSYLAEGNYDIYITGSNSKLLSGELATYLTGRFVEIKIYPFSFLEYLEYKKTNNKYLNEYEQFKEYMKYGGMPSTFDFEEIEKTQYLQDLYNSIIFKDILAVQ